MKSFDQYREDEFYNEIYKRLDEITGWNAINMADPSPNFFRRTQHGQYDVTARFGLHESKYDFELCDIEITITGNNGEYINYQSDIGETLEQCMNVIKEMWNGQ